MNRAALLITLAFVAGPAHAQEPAAATTTWAERLGFPKGKTVLLLHADDIGMCSEANEAAKRYLSKGEIQSAAAMVPCPWFDEFAAWAKDRPDLDIGLHLTLTSEWKHYRWPPVAPKAEVPGLVDKSGYMPRTVLEVALGAKPAEIERELRAQIEHSLARGLKPGHLDTHMGALYATAAFTSVYLKVAREYGIPAMVIEMTPQRIADFRKQGYPLDLALLDVVNAYPGPKLDNFMAVKGGKSYEEVRATFLDTVRGLEPGITEMIFHPSDATEGLKKITNSWQARGWDARLFSDPVVKRTLQELGVLFTDWKDMARRFEKSAPAEAPAAAKPGRFF